MSLATDKRNGVAASAAKVPLSLLSLAYGQVIRSLAFFQGLAPFSTKVKVVSVGNITLGGTGKTMLVEYAVRLLQGQGLKVAVLSRGYKRAKGVSGLYGTLGDEAAMLRKKFPGLAVFVDPDRARSLRTAAAGGIQAAILDDGFQQWRIRKDLDIVCVDAAGFGNRRLIPRGVLREPLSALRRAHVFVLTNTGIVPPAQAAGVKELLGKLNPSALIVESDHEPLGVFRMPAGSPVAPARMGKAALVCGIGNPASFFDCCRRAGIVAGPRLAFPDHHRFGPNDIERIAGACAAEGIKAVVTTEKDEVRLPVALMEEHGLELYTLKAAVRFTGNEERLSARLRGLFAA